jgi:hypothetical protein
MLKEWHPRLTYFGAWSAIYDIKNDLLRRRLTAGCGEPPVLALPLLTTKMAVYTGVHN